MARSSALGGTTSAAALAGTATFSNLTLNKGGSGYTLIASGTGLTPATSNTFNVTVAAGITFAPTGACPVRVGNGGLFTRSVTLVDGNGNVVTNQTGATMTFNITFSPNKGSVAPTSVSIVDGASTSGNFTYTRDKDDVTVTATKTTPIAWTTSCGVNK